MYPQQGQQGQQQYVPTGPQSQAYPYPPPGYNNPPPGYNNPPPGYNYPPPGYPPQPYPPPSYPPPGPAYYPQAQAQAPPAYYPPPPQQAQAPPQQQAPGPPQPQPHRPQPNAATANNSTINPGDGRLALVARHPWQDVLWILPFVAQVAVVMYFSISIGVDEWNKGLLKTQDYWGPLAVAPFWGIGWGAAWLSFLSCCPYPLIVISIWMGPVSAIVSCILTFLNGNFVIGILMAILAALSVFWALALMKRIPFTLVMIRKALSLSVQFWSIYGYSILTISLYLVYLAAWTCGVAGATARERRRTPPPKSSKGTTTTTSGGNNYWYILLGFMFSQFWTATVAINVVTVTTAGTIGAWYFYGSESVPAYASTRAFGRAISKSFGSICFGSLLTALIRTLRWVVHEIRRRTKSQIAAIMLCLTECLIGWLDRLVQRFNTYAYVQVAVYGKKYTQAAQDTWDLFKAKGVMALVHYDITASVLGLGALLGGVLSALGTGLWVNYKNGGRLSRAATIGFFALPVASMMTMIIFQTLLGIGITLFVLYAEDPHALRSLDPEFFDEIQNVQNRRLAKDPQK